MPTYSTSTRTSVKLQLRRFADAYDSCMIMISMAATCHCHVHLPSALTLWQCRRYRCSRKKFFSAASVRSTAPARTRTHGCTRPYDVTASVPAGPRRAQRTASPTVPDRARCPPTSTLYSGHRHLFRSPISFTPKTPAWKPPTYAFQVRDKGQFGAAYLAC